MSAHDRGPGISVRILIEAISKITVHPERQLSGRFY
jgi:hypothetical protein